MTITNDDWLATYCLDAKDSDILTDRDTHLDLLAAGLVGEVGEVLAELKKRERDGVDSDAARSRIIEELGDLLWYLVRLIQVATEADPDIADIPSYRGESVEDGPMFLELAGAAISIAKTLQYKDRTKEAPVDGLDRLWACIAELCSQEGMTLSEVAEVNIKKRRSRWRQDDAPYHEMFDENMDSMEQLPRKITIDVLEHPRENGQVVVLRCNDINVGDRLTDNRHDKDYYRYHDVFHMANAVYLGWSPVLRALLRCKRKSDSVIDENEDGGRARVVEEAIVALVFTYAKQRYMLEDVNHIEYNLLKTIAQLVRGFEVDQVPLWQWEKAVLAGTEAFRKVKAWGSARLVLDLESHVLLCKQIPKRS